jgi:glucosamine--fructose-6-phosphate aminotransferase (isomerizing)
MCQLAAYVGDRLIAPLLLRAIENQEPLLGAHASGMGVVDRGVLRIEKDFGHVRRVRSTTAISTLEGSVGIAHTRFSSNARDDPRYNTREMTHPFIDDTGKLALMHNGVLFNYREH